jgi:2-polyprenyl-3-methyl-5-hydroxy-6-metoxy-1,4-benzoquinol methylase
MNTENSRDLTKECPVCLADAATYVREVPTRRTKKLIPLYKCADCGSLWNLSSYKEDSAQLERDLQWGIGVAERNRNAATRLLDKLAESGASLESILEVGCGIGTLLTVARSRGSKVVGFDVNQTAIRYAKETNGIHAHSELWSSSIRTETITLFLCISVLEHIAEPRPLIKELCRATSANGASLFISVPFFEGQHQRFLEDPDPTRPGTPFFDNDVHVTHFSRSGLEKALRREGLFNLTFIEAGLWNGFLALPNITSS